MESGKNEKPMFHTVARSLDYRLLCIVGILFARVFPIDAHNLHRSGTGSYGGFQDDESAYGRRISLRSMSNPTPGQTLQSLYMNDIDLQINPYTSKCPSKHCNLCKIRVQRTLDKKDMHCDSEAVKKLLKSSGCESTDYYWVVERMSTDGILECDYDVTVTCCELKYLMQTSLTTSCQGELTCPTIFGRPTCQPYTMMTCKCFDGVLPLSNQEVVPECPDPSWSEVRDVCRKSSDHPSGQNCLCDPRFDVLETQYECVW